MFADDTNLFYSHHQIKVLFETVNAELQKISQWFRANKLSLNVKKTNYTLFHKCSLKDKMSLKLPELKPDHKYPTKFAQFNYSLRKHSLSSSKFSISYREQIME